MECPLRWAKIKIIIYLSIYACHVLCQNKLQGGTSSASGQVVYRESAKETPCTNTVSPTPQLLNTILTIAAANGVLPDLLPILQPLRKLPSDIPSSIQDSQKAMSIAPVQQPSPLSKQDPVFAATQPMISTVSHTNIAVPIQSSTYTPTPLTSTVAVVPPLVISPGLNQVSQQNNPFIPPISEFSQSPPLISHSQPSEEVLMSGQSILPIANVPNNYEIIRSNAEPIYANSILTTESGQSLPVNLQISIPPPNVEAPRITFINAALPVPPIESSKSTEVNPFPYPNWYPYGYPTPNPPQQIIVRKRKSLFKDWLPLILFSLFNNDGGHNNNCGRCCCSCNSGWGNSVPIPYPIPIPTNNPIINTGSYPHLSRNRGSKSNVEDDDE